MNAKELDQTLADVSSAAIQAGRVIMPFYQKACATQLKVDRSPVTEADFASHELLARALRGLSPQLRVISEESADGGSAPGSLAEDYWLIDPLDGTKEFLKGNPEFTVNIALMHQQRPVLGVVHAPALGLTYSALQGRGAWRQEVQGTQVPVRTRVADVNRLTVVASKDHSGPQVKRLLEKLRSPKVTSIGSSLKFCLVAEGRADLYLRDLPTMEWDTAAAQCVVEAAGGAVLELDGEPLRYGKPGLKNPGFIALGEPNFRWQDFDGD